jgi:hypothetical protein
MALSVGLVKTDVVEEPVVSIFRLIDIAKVVPTSRILSTLKMKSTRSFKTSVPGRFERRHIPEDDILHSHRRENLKSYIALTGWTL